MICPNCHRGYCTWVKHKTRKCGLCGYTKKEDNAESSISKPGRLDGATGSK